MNNNNSFTLTNCTVDSYSDQNFNGMNLRKYRVYNPYCMDGFDVWVDLSKYKDQSKLPEVGELVRIIVSAAAVYEGAYTPGGSNPIKAVRLKFKLKDY